MKNKNVEAITIDFFGFLIMATAAICIGLFLNQFQDKPLTLIYTGAKASGIVDNQFVSGYSTPDLSIIAKSNTQITLQRFVSFQKQKEGLILDARPEVFYRIGHVPGSLCLARDDFGNRYAAIKEKIGTDKDQPIVVYCQEVACQDSLIVRDELTKLGYRHVLLFRGGWAEWSGAGLEEEQAP